MRPLFVITTSTLALASVAACSPTQTAGARAALDCPTAQGELTRASVSADGKTCLYRTSSGDEVSLRLLPVSNSDVRSVLTPIELELASQIAAAEPEGAPAAGGVAKADAELAAAANAASEAERTAREAAQDAAARADDADPDPNPLPGRDDGDGPAHINLPGLHINADDESARVDIAGIHINAGDGGAEIRSSKDVRLKGEAFSRQKRGFRASYILARDDLKDGYKAVGYEAGGPKSGPVTVAVVKSREGDHDGLVDDVKKLVRRNAGV